MTGREGQQSGNYQLVHRLGHGGFADVYLGEHIHLKTYAAIKILHARVEEDGWKAFRAEARTLVRLKHPHIVEVLDFGVDDGCPYLIMQYAPGGTLRQRHPRGSQLQPDRVVGYVKQVAAALQHAHHYKLIHRDIKPENLLVGEQGQVLLSDFGISIMTASASLENSEQAASPRTAGTISYMAPEQIKGCPVPASDQYALAIVVYEWLTGQVPFRGTNLEILSQHLLAEPTPLHVHCPSIPRAVEEVVLRALTKEPARRFASVAEFATALEEAATNPAPAPEPTPGTPIPVSPSPLLPPRPPTPTTPRRVDRNKFSWKRALALVALVLLMLSGSVGGLWLSQRNQALQQQTRAASQATGRAQATATSLVTSPYPAFSRLAFFDPLTDPNSSILFREQEPTCVFRAKSYQVNSERTGYMTECTAIGSDFSNFAYQITLTLIKGDCGGLEFRRTDDNNFDVYEICQDGTFFAAAVHNNIASPKPVLQPGAYLHQGLNQANTLAVVVQNTTVNLFANGKQIGTLTDNTATHGEISLFAANKQHPTVVSCTGAAVWTAPL